MDYDDWDIVQGTLSDSADEDYTGDAESDISNSSDIDEEAPPIQISTTKTLRDNLQRSGTSTASKVLEIIQTMKSVGLNLPLFLDAICWGDKDCEKEPIIQYQRTALMASDEFPGILKRCHKPPRSHNRGKKASGAWKPLETMAVDVVGSIIDREMNAIAPLMRSPAAEFTPKALIDISFVDLICDLKSSDGCPTLWAILHRASYSKQQDKKNTSKLPDLTQLMQIVLASYSRSHHRSRIPKLLSLYLKVCGLSARAFDMLHAFGITMSHRWTYDGLETLSENAVNDMKEILPTSHWFISHDNLNIPFRVYEQRTDNQNHFDSGCAATVFVVQNPGIPRLSNHELKANRRDPNRNCFDAEAVLMSEVEAGADVFKRDVHRVLRFLLESVDFDLKTYVSKDSPLFNAPPAVDLLPCGPLYATLQFMLATVHMEEASYEGNSKLVEEWFRQMGLSSLFEKVRTGAERVIAWIGDQLTIARLRGLFNYRGEDDNSFDRMDYLVLVFGWFHLQMTFATSLYDQYLGTSGGHGLQQAFDLLARKGLKRTSTKGPFHHHLEEAIYHVGEAHIRACWLLVGRVTNLADLRINSPVQLRELAGRIVREHASQGALQIHDELPEAHQDEVKRQMIMWNCDVLRYFDLDEAMKVGDVGIMEQLMPHLLYRFAGGKNSKYAVELLELYQAILEEWPEDIAHFVKHHCWLVNMSGRRDGFLPVDMAQEHNVRDIKYTFGSMGPLATWDYLKKISPGIPALRAVKDHIERELHTLTQGKHHTSPAKEGDIVRLVGSFTVAGLHITTPNRKFRSKTDKAPDNVARGVEKMLTGTLIESWWSNRFLGRASTEDWREDTTN